MQGATDQLTHAVREAGQAGTRLAPRGSGQWWPDTPPLARALGPLGPAEVVRVEAADLVATAGAACPLDHLERRLAEHGAWLALDPPGPRTRTLGGALAAGGGGPLAALFGPPRDQVLGLTIVAGNGVVVKTGGRVVKNVAGFDIAKVVIGGHGALGVIVEAHLRLRARPEADETRGYGGDLDAVASAARRALAGGVAPAALEVVSPPLARVLGVEEGWTLLARGLGTGAGAAEELDALEREVLSSGACCRLSAGEGVWDRWRAEVGGWPVVLRIGAEPAAWPEALALAERHLGSGTGASVTVPRGTVRIGLQALEPAAAAMLRRQAASHGWPVTLERADAATREAVGIWGALGERVLDIARALRATFDPLRLFAVPLWAE